MSDKIDIIAPLPEAIDGQRWDIRSSPAARVDLRTHTMYVPLTASESDHYLRLHEMAHAKWTPRGPSKEPGKVAARLGVDPNTLQVVEDLRMHTNLALRGFKLAGACDEEGLARAILRDIAQPDPLTPVVHTMVATLRTGDFERYNRALYYIQNDGKLPEETRRIAAHVREKGIEIVDRTKQMLEQSKGMYRKAGSYPNRHAVGPSFADTERVARYLQDELAAADKRPKPAGSVTIDEQSDAETKDLLKKISHREFMKPKSSKVTWGKASFKALALTETVKTALVARGKKACDYGVVPTNLHRMCIDQRVFSVKKRARGGTVLIDVSGSMSLSTDDIDKILTHAPCATVAMYAGHGYEGTLTVIAANGHRANSKAIQRAITDSGGGNIIDGPALDWLAKQQEPRIWVCDGIVTVAPTDECTLPALMEAFAKANRANVRRFSNTRMAVEAFALMKKGRRAEGAHLEATKIRSS